MNDDTERYVSLIIDLDEGPWEVTKWEASFLASVMEIPPEQLSQRQKDVLEDMADKYGIV